MAEYAYEALWLLAGATWFTGSTGLARKEGLAGGRVVLGTLLLAATFVLGARVYEQLLETGSSPLALLTDLGWVTGRQGGRQPGGLLAAAVCAPLIARALSLPLRRWCDATAVFAGFGLALGRVGCWVASCCHGSATTMPWSVTFEQRSAPWFNQFAQGLIPIDAPHTLPVHPTPLYFVAAGIATTAAVAWIYSRRRYPGQVTLWGIALIGIGTGLIENFRDTSFEHVPFRQALPLSSGILAIALIFIAFRQTREKSPIQSRPSLFDDSRQAVP